jgi:ribonuclease R
MSEDAAQGAMVAGFKIPKNPTREELQGLLNATRGTPAARAVHMAVLRTLTKAEYSPALIGHFALASEAYAHFTSPIRRYADLTVHRALAEYLRHRQRRIRPAKSTSERKAPRQKAPQTARCARPRRSSREIGKHARDARRERRGGRARAPRSSSCCSS